MSVRDQIIEHVIEEEGGLVDHPSDPGGITKYGISLRAHPYLGRDGIKNLTIPQATEIYRREYWNRIGGDSLPPAIAMVIMDAAVNSGVSRSIRWAQVVLNIDITGKLTDKLVEKLSGIGEQGRFVDAYCDTRLNFLRKLKTFDTFGRGWTARVERVRGRAIKLLQ